MVVEHAHQVALAALPHVRAHERPLLGQRHANAATVHFHEAFGVEDLRISLVENQYLLTYSAYSRHGVRIALARTRDFEKVERIALITQADLRNVVIFPEKFGERYVRLDRPHSEISPWSIWISYSNDLIHWGNHRVLISPRPGMWDSFRVGASVPPIKTAAGWLEIYHGVKMTSTGPIYKIGSALLDLDDPTRLIARCSEPLLAPRELYERIGDVNNVVFACGAIIEPDGEIKIYYGAADTCICVATAPFDDILKRTSEC